MPPTVVIPVNRFDRAKGRLADRLAPGQREALAIATFRTVAAAARDAGLMTIALAVDADSVMKLNAVHEVIGESPSFHGLNEQLEGLIGQLGPEVLILHGDLPLVDGAAISRFLQHADGDIALVRSTDGGTNAMLLRPPGGISLGYGADSFDRHLRRAKEAGLHATVIEEFVLSLDLDTPEDIERFLAVPGAEETPAGRVLAMHSPG